MKKNFTIAMAATCLSSIAQNPNQGSNAIWQAEGSAPPTFYSLALPGTSVESFP